MVFCFFNYFKSVCYNCFTVSFPLSFLFCLFTYNVLLKWRKKFFHSHFSNIHYLQTIYIYCKLLFFPMLYFQMQSKNPFSQILLLFEILSFLIRYSSIFFQFSYSFSYSFRNAVRSTCCADTRLRDAKLNLARYRPG